MFNRNMGVTLWNHKKDPLPSILRRCSGSDHDDVRSESFGDTCLSITESFFLVLGGKIFEKLLM